MNWVSALAGILVLWAGTAWGATLTWNTSSEPDLAGYRVYQCSLQPCTKSSGKASLLVTLGKGTSFNIGTPAVTQYYFITAYDFANKESSGSNVVTFTPVGSPPPPPATVAPITLDAVSSSEGTSFTSHDHTVASDANALIVCLAIRDTGGAVQPAKGVTVEGKAATFLIGATNANQSVARTELWYYLSPPTRSGVTVAATGHASTEAMVTGVMTFKGVAQSSTFNTAASAEDSSANADVKSIASAVGEMGVYCGTIQGAAATVSADAAESASTEQYEDRHSGANLKGFGYTEDGAAPSITMRVNLSGSANWAAAAVSLRPAD